MASGSGVVDTVGVVAAEDENNNTAQLVTAQNLTTTDKLEWNENKCRTINYQNVLNKFGQMWITKSLTCSKTDGQWTA